MKNDFDLLGLPHSKQNIQGQLIQAFIRQFLGSKLPAVEGERLYAVCIGSAITPERCCKFRCCAANLSEQRLNLTIFIKLTCLIFKDQIVSHAAASEFPHAGFIFTTIRMCIEMARPLVSRVFQQFDQEEEILN